MNTPIERDELAQEIADVYLSNLGAGPLAGKITQHDLADAILAVGYRRPRIITTVEELDALGEGSVVLCRGRAWTRFTPKNIHGGIVQIHKWMCPDGGIVRAESLSQDILLPATVLHDGAAK